MADWVPPPPWKPPLASRTYSSAPLRTIAASCATVGAGSPPLKPPIVTTGLPVAMMIGAALPEPDTATRYFAEPWWASRYRMSAVEVAPWSSPMPPPGPPKADADAGPARGLLPLSARPEEGTGDEGGPGPPRLAGAGG